MVKLLLLILFHDLILANGQTLIKRGMQTLGDVNLMSPAGLWHFLKFCATNIKVWSGLALNSVSLCLWIIILSFADLSQAYPLDSMQYVIIAILAKFSLKEKVSPLRWTGIAVIVIGIIIVGIK
jgi:drug/metabolite transporter (DMT)-like permease